MADNYKAKNIVVLEGLDAVRLRPGMYIGTTGIKGLHHILWEIVDNAMDEAANGYADTLRITINVDGSATVEDNGRGIPVDIHPVHKKSGVELVYTVLHAGGKFDNEEYKFSGGLHGVGASVTNALSEWCKVEVFKDKKEYCQEFHSVMVNGKMRSGIPVAPLKQVGNTKKRGTKVTFFPDAKVFETIIFDRNTIKNRLQELAYLNKGVKIIFTDERELDDEGNVYSREFFYKGGLVDFVKKVNEKKEKKIEKVIYIEAKQDNFELELAIQYTNSEVENVISFVNNIPTIEGGTHETGFKQAFTRCMNDYVKKNNLRKSKDPALIGDDFREGMTAILSIKMQNIQFEGQTKTKLGNPEVKGIVESIVGEKLGEYLSENKNKDIATHIVKVGVDASKVRDAQKKAKDAQRSKNATTSQALISSKFAACSGRKAEKNELFIVEGDSAGGSAKQGRDRSFQAVLPLRGKPKNTEGVKKFEVIKNEEFNTLIYALGTDFDKDFNIKNLKYDKIIILADADHDGEHIRSLLLTFFYRHMRPLISEGHVYFGMPPLYKIEKKGEIKYAYNDIELEKMLAEIKGSYSLQRYKGLGEMNPEQLWETTLNPKTRTLARITVDDVVEADNIISILMGKDPAPRKEFINENARFNKEDTFVTKFGG